MDHRRAARIFWLIPCVLFVVLAVIELLTRDLPSWFLVICAFAAGACAATLLDIPRKGQK